MEYIAVLFKYLGYILNWQPFGMHGVNSLLSIRGIHIIFLAYCIYGIYKIIQNERENKGGKKKNV